MKEEILKEILYDLSKAVDILKTRETKDVTELETLSSHAIEDIAVHKDLELVSITVLLYSLYKIINTISPKEYTNLLKELEAARNALQHYDLGHYNRSIKRLYEIVRKSDTKVKEHLQDVMQAARIKKGEALLQRGLSIGQAAGLMGLSNWDLQPYAGKTVVLTQHDETFPVKKRVMVALKLFGVKN